MVKYRGSVARRTSLQHCFVLAIQYAIHIAVVRVERAHSYCSKIAAPGHRFGGKIRHIVRHVECSQRRAVFKSVIVNFKHTLT